ncbi:MAG TPA: hypothetical protein PKM87_09125 [Methanolinea sp.]|nr:hypothetical protein [Methanolinea sp.]
MSRYFGYRPSGTVRTAVESFESTTQVRSVGRVLLGTVYVDIRETEWAVAVAYGRTHHPKIREPELVYEVRYAYRTGDGTQVTKLDTQEDSPRKISAESFPSVDAFVLWALNEESGRIRGTNN